MKKENKVSKKSKTNINDFPTLKIATEVDIATDFSNKVYHKFDKLIKSIVLFGSTVKKTNTVGSDIDLIIIVDDASVQFDQELISWYREELGKIIAANPYKKELHINTVKLTTWWSDLLRGDPVIINIIRYGEEILDFGGFFRPLRVLLQQGRIKSTPEAIYSSLERAPIHLLNSKKAQLSTIEGLYWAMVDSANALLMAAKVTPPSPEHIPALLNEYFVAKKIIDSKCIIWYSEVYRLYKGIMHGQINELKGQNIEDLQDKTTKFIGIMAETINKIL
jgi:predicted nucleotidyltransferase/uncharacterized protein (UPF0332 family)